MSFSMKLWEVSDGKLTDLKSSVLDREDRLENWIAEVTQEAVMLDQFIVEDKGKPLSEVPLKATRATENLDDPELAEWAVRVNWYKTFSKGEAKTFKGTFANQNIACKLRHPETVDFLVKEFDV